MKRESKFTTITELVHGEPALPPPGFSQTGFELVMNFAPAQDLLPKVGDLVKIVYPDGLTYAVRVITRADADENVEYTVRREL